MKTTRRGLLGWVAALFGGAAVAKVAPAEASPLNEMAAAVVRNSKLPSHSRPVYRLPETEAMRAGRLLAEQHARDIAAGRVVESPYAGGGTPADFRALLQRSGPVRLEHDFRTGFDSDEDRRRRFAREIEERDFEDEQLRLRALFAEPHAGLGRMRYGSDTERCPGHARGCDLGAGHTPCFIRNDRDDYCDGGT